MSIENEIFLNHLIDREQLVKYGFQPEGDHLVYSVPLPEDGFEIVIEYDGAIWGSIMDLAAGGEYVSYRIESATGYSAGIRQRFVDLLMDIRESCCRNQYFKTPQARRICEYIGATYGVSPEFLWRNIPSYAAFRLKGTKKWFAVMGSVPRYKLDPDSGEHAEVEVINVRVDGAQIRAILDQRGYYPAFHMNRKYWVSIILEDALPDAEIQERIRYSYESL